MSDLLEKRQMGALALIVRKQAAGNFCPQEKVVLLIRDEGKIEQSSGLPQQRDPQPNHLTYAVPAGGRQETAQGKQETITETLQREMAEELSGYSFAVIEALTQQLTLKEVQRLAYPFLVAQWRTHLRTIDMIPVASIAQEFDALPREIQHEIERGIDYVGEERFWAPIRALNDWYEMLAQSGAEDRRINHLFRPQALTAAHLYYLEYVARMPAEMVTPQIIKGNKGVYGSVQKFMDTHGGWQLNNGTMLADGSLNFNVLSEEDTNYLVGKNYNL